MENKKFAFVTGGAKRVGRDISIHLAKKGYHLGVHYNSSEKEAYKVKEEIESLGSSCLLFKADLSNEGQISPLVKEVKKSFPHFNLLIHNSSIFREKSFKDSALDDFNDNFNLHVKAPYFLTQGLHSQMEEGQVINILDTRISSYPIDHFPYTLSKKALADLTKMMARALGPKIRVNGLCPGPILAPDDRSSEDFEKQAKNNLLQKTGGPSELLLGLDYLLANTFVTGQFLFLDGGQNLN